MSDSVELVLVVVLARSLHLPPVLGYLLVGVAIGPHALHWIRHLARLPFGEGGG